MAAWARIAGAAVLIAGLLLVAASVVVGASRVALLLIFPVLFGGSPLFVAGVLLLLVGMLWLGLALVAGGGERRTAPLADAPAGSGEAVGRGGGFVLIGPVPIFFGRARSLEGRYYWVAVAAGAALFLSVLALFYFG